MALGQKSVIIVRPATQDDIDFVANVLLLADIERNQKKQGWNEKAFLKQAKTTTEDEVQENVKDSTTYVIESDGDRVGRLRVIRTSEQLKIAGIQVLPSYQRKRIGTAVIESLIQEGKTKGLPVVLDVAKDNPNAKRLYLWLGFEQCGESDDHFWMTI